MLILRYIRTIAMMFVVIVITMLFSYSSTAHAAAACEAKVAQIVSAQGIVELRRAGQTNWQQAVMNMMLCPGDMLRVRADSRAALRLANDSMLRLDQRTAITFPQVQDNKATTLLDLFNGALHILTRTPKPFKIRTPFVNAGVEGTEFFVSVDEDSTHLVIYEGQVSASNEWGTLMLVDHEAAIARQNAAPQKVGIISPTDAVQWALYYPTIIDTHQLEETLTSEPAWPQLQASITLYRQGRFFEALKTLDKVPPSAHTAQFLNYNVGLLLSLGRVDEAQAAVKLALQLESDSSDAYALKAIIAVVQNEKQKALALASQAVELNQTSATAKLALSYAQQAHFEIEQALISVQKAVKIDTQNALAWARLAELHMSTGQLDHALESASQAVNLNPTLAKTQTVLGFANLLQIDTEAAKSIFMRAIALDQADPMPRLGLGLALIREGDLEAGRIELEIAVSLDPANSLIRSYLGKAYFEEKRYPLASTQFDMAKERDPNDPTPWFYDAIQKQTQNRPIEALGDIQKSIELNDNRAVYRSKLLLDQDQAGRGTSLARIYGNLGFEKRAIMETAKSLAYDPSNHSAHRFLSDTYANVPRHEVARVSELLQAQLLQPINVNPVQPHATVPDLNIITNTGPFSTGFNEFAPLMERNRPQVVASGVVGNQGTLGNEVVFSQLYNRTSVSLGQFHYETNGFRPNNDQNHNIYNAFIQHAFSPKINVQAEVRREQKEHGDLKLDFFNPKKSDEDKKRKFRKDTVRLGAKYSLSKRQDIILSTVYINRNIKGTNLNQHQANVNSVSDIYQTEVQYLFRDKFFNIVMGGGFSSRKTHITDTDTSYFTSIYNDKFERENAYLYTLWNLPFSINTTLGFSFNRFSANRNNATGYKINELDPKFGLQWNITENVRLRLAWIETIKNDLLIQQTIEPTQVAGFNQFFDDPNGTKSKRKGAGLDFQISNNLYGGVEGSIRKLNIPIITRNGFFEQQTEKSYRTYLYGLLSSNWSITGEIEYENHKQKNGRISNNINTFSAPARINYFHPSGAFASLKGTYVNQKVESSSETDASNFFLLDAVTGYRLPSRKGLISFEIKNIFDKNFKYRNPWFTVAEPVVPRYIPSRTFFFQLTINF